MLRVGSPPPAPCPEDSTAPADQLPRPRGESVQATPRPGIAAEAG
jgi:hypothetical protein